MQSDAHLGNIGTWTFNQERVHLEDIVHKRIALLLTIFSAVIAGVVSNEHFRIVILLLGMFVCGIIGETIARVHKKLDAVIDLLNRVDGHPIAWANQAVGGRSGYRLIGLVIPRFCTLILFLGLLISSYQALVRP